MRPRLVSTYPAWFGLARLPHDSPAGRGGNVQTGFFQGGGWESNPLPRVDRVAWRVRRVGAAVTRRASHGSGRAPLTHPAPPVTVSLPDEPPRGGETCAACGRAWKTSRRVARSRSRRTGSPSRSRPADGQEATPQRNRE